MSSQDKLNRQEIENERPETPVDDDRLQLDLRLGLDEVAAAEEEQLHASSRRQPSKKELVRLACKLYDARRGRDRLFNSRLFGEPAWDMLLALYGLPSRGELLSVTSLGYAADVPPSTALRWQRTLIEEGLIERFTVEFDTRLQLVRLTPKGQMLLERYLIKLFYCGQPAPPGPNTADR